MLRRGRGRPLRPPGAIIQLLGCIPETEPYRVALGPSEAVWRASALSGVGLRLYAPRGGPGIRLDPGACRALSSGLYEAHRGTDFRVDAEMALGYVGVRAETRVADGIPQVSLWWARSPGVLLIGAAEMSQLAAVAELGADFATEWPRVPDLEYWVWEASQVPGVEVADATTGISLPRRKPRSVVVPNAA